MYKVVTHEHLGEQREAVVVRWEFDDYEAAAAFVTSLIPRLTKITTDTDYECDIVDKKASITQVPGKVFKSIHAAWTYLYGIKILGNVPDRVIPVEARRASDFLIQPFLKGDCAPEMTELTEENIESIWYQ